MTKGWPRSATPTNEAEDELGYAAFWCFIT
jgi:hypothetical protein